MLSGLRSLCTMPSVCRYSITWRTFGFACDGHSRCAVQSIIQDGPQSDGAWKPGQTIRMHNALWLSCLGKLPCEVEHGDMAERFLVNQLLH